MISAIILTKNEEQNIQRCIKSVRWCDEIIVIDDCSKDNTVEISKKFGAKVFIRELNNDFSNQRNFGLEKAKGEWVLFVDADERVGDGLREEITHLTINHDRAQQLNGYFIKRTDFLWGKELKYGETGNIKLLRLAKKNAGKCEGKVHESWKIKGLTGELKNPLFHYPHQTLSEFLKEINFYTTVRAEELYKNGSRAVWSSIIFYPFGKFALNYFIKKGLLDGIQGLIFAITMSFHSFLVRAKLWRLVHNK